MTTVFLPGSPQQLDLSRFLPGENADSALFGGSVQQ